MTRFQVMVVALCLIMNIIEGFDILVMSFAASGVAAEWHLSGSEIGLLLSSSLIGMALGSAALSPLADRFGRRPMTLWGLSIATVGMIAAAMASGFVQLALFRVLTGIGVGAVMGCLPVIINEYSSRRGRGTATAFFALGLPLGGVIGGSIAALVTAQYGWRATFALGAVLSVITVVAMLRLLPESLDHLLSRRPAGALDAVNGLLARMRIAPLTELPPPPPAAARKISSAVLRGRNGVRSVLLWVGFASLLGSLYFASGWTPRLLEQGGLTAQQGISGGILLNLGGVAGTLLITVLALRFTSTTLAVATMACAGAAFLLMTLSLGTLSATMIAAVAVGLFLNANGAVMYTIAPTLYPAAVRTTGVGWAIAVGRLGAIVAPLLAGVLVDSGWTGANLFGLFAVVLVVAAVAMLALGRIKPPAPVAADVRPVEDPVGT